MTVMEMFCDECQQLTQIKIDTTTVPVTYEMACTHAADILYALTGKDLRPVGGPNHD